MILWIQMKITYDDQYLVTVSEDSCVLIWKIQDKEGRGIKRDKEVGYAEEILITKSDLEEKVRWALSLHTLPFFHGILIMICFIYKEQFIKLFVTETSSNYDLSRYSITHFYGKRKIIFATMFLHLKEFIWKWCTIQNVKHCRNSYWMRCPTNR